MEDIIKAFNELGWALYEAEDEETLDDVIPRGPVKQLEIFNQYVVIPLTEKPTSIDEVKSAVNKMLMRKEHPITIFEDESIPMSLFYIQNQDSIVVRYNREITLTHNEFLRIIKKLPDIK